MQKIYNNKLPVTLPKKLLYDTTKTLPGGAIYNDYLGTASQLRLNRHPPLLCSNRIFDRLGDFSCGRVAGCGPRSLCLIAAGSAMETCFRGLRCRFGGVERGTGGCPGCLVVGGVSQSIGFI